MVSVKCREKESLEPSWHLGLIKNISEEGLFIESRSLNMLQIPSDVELIYFPEKNNPDSEVFEPEPVKKMGRLIWQNMEKMAIGIQLNHKNL